ncbi:hypothetical protein OAL21_02910, partial [Akkermansiaceae bacterium]|nr:hypothetical protein [Akkermansiaceae bacterium]
VAKKGLFSFIRAGKSSKYIPLFLFLLLPGLLSTLWADFNWSGFRWSVLLLLQFLLAFLLIKPRRWSKYDKIAKLFVYTVTVLALVSIIRSFTDLSFLGLSLPVNSFTRLNGWMRSPNHFSAYIALGLLIEWHYYMTRSDKSIFRIFKIGLFFLVIILSGSRGTLVALFLVLIVESLSSLRNISAINLVKRCGLYFFVLLMTYLLHGAVLEFFGHTTQDFGEKILRVDEQAYDNSRVEIWTLALSSWMDGDLWSKLGGFGKEASYTLTGRSTHNSYLTYLIDFGIIYTVGLLLIVFYFLWRTWKIASYSKDYLLIFSIILFLASRSVTNNIFGGVGVFQIIFNMCLIITLSHHEGEKDSLRS